MPQPTKVRTDIQTIVRNQCEKTALDYFAYRKKQTTPNDLIDFPSMLELIGPLRGKTILDVGCGFGATSVHCARQGAHVTGIDISETMVRLSREEASQAGVSARFLVQDAARMIDIPSESFDLALCNVAICFELQAVFHEVSRVLKSPGAFCFSEVHPFLDASRLQQTESGPAWIVDEYFNREMRTAKNVFGKTQPDQMDYEWRWEHYTLEDYANALQRAGFLIEALREPRPAPEARSLSTKLFDRASRFPHFIQIRALKA